ncbi:hypothetical protein ACJX0J_013483, partial [Zea mays]
LRPVQAQTNKEDHPGIAQVLLFYGMQHDYFPWKIIILPIIVPNQESFLQF